MYYKLFDKTCKEMEKEFEEIDTKAQEKTNQQPTLMDLYKEMNRLKLENECLKADNIELHNIINGNNKYDTVVDGNEDLSYIDEYAKGYSEEELANAYIIADKNYKFV